MKPATEGDGGDDELALVATKTWIDAFRSQWTPDLALFARRYARVQCRKVGLMRTIDESFSLGMVQDVVGDTVLGVIAWNPERVSLKKHLLDAIQSRSRHAFVHALKFRHVSIDEFREEVEKKLEEEYVAIVAATAFAGDVLEALRALARSDDSDLRRLFDAYEKGATRRFDILKITGLSAKQYDSARHRLRRLVRDLPPHIRPDTG
jgi:hypothetical protein